jgi:hypothetical protein
VPEKILRYTLPPAVVVLEALPLTPNGKFDTRAYQHPNTPDADQYRAPANVTGEILARIYARYSLSSRSGSTTRSSTWVGIRYRQCASSPAVNYGGG